MPRGGGQFDGDLMPGHISRVGGYGRAADFGFEFSQLLQAEAALLIQCGAQRGEMVAQVCW